LISSLSNKSGRGLHEGDRVRLFGGYEMEPKWLGGKDAHLGRCLGFIQGQNKQRAAIIELDEKVTFGSKAGKIVVLELRYVGARWSKREVVHLELCDFLPEDKAWNERKRGDWIESHAIYQVIGPE
jgi:hypothetical protein